MDIQRLNGHFRRKQYASIFCILWLTVFILYLPAKDAGWVTDTVDWLELIKHAKFIDYINVMQKNLPSLYQFTQFTTYLIYQVLGTSHLLWFLLCITIQAINGTLVFIISKKLFDNTGIKNSFIITFCAAFLFMVCPHISEVVIWKAAFHYLQAMFLSLTIIYLLQKFHSTPKTKYVWWGCILFFLSTFSLELFYLTPWFALSLVIYYRLLPSYNKSLFKKEMLYFVLPLFILFFIHLLTLYTITGSYAAHLGENAKQPIINYLRKAPVYVYHIIFLGRFFSNDLRAHFYVHTTSIKGLSLFYGITASIWIYIAFRLHKMRSKGKLAVLFFTWLCISIALVSPLWVPDIQYVAYDRYAYFMLPPAYLLFMMMLTSINSRIMITSIFTIYAIINIYFTSKVNMYWRRSNKVVYNLIKSFPGTDNKKAILLNLPDNMYGIPMLGTLPHSVFETMCNIYNPGKIQNQLYDIAEYNMNTTQDGAHIAVINDSTLHVTLNQWGTWWWYRSHGGQSYETIDFKLNMIDVGHWYELTLKHPHDGYILLYCVGEKWKTVDWSQKNIDQY